MLYLLKNLICDDPSCAHYHEYHLSDFVTLEHLIHLSSWVQSVQAPQTTIERLKMAIRLTTHMAYTTAEIMQMYW